MSLTPFVELLHENCSPLIISLMELQKELKSLTVRMNIGGGGFFMIVGTIFSSSKSMSRMLSFSSEGSVLFENKEKRFFETNTLLFCVGELGD